MENAPDRPSETAPEKSGEAVPTLAPATGVEVSGKPGFSENEEPVVTGTLFLTMIFLMMILGFWVTVYYMLITR